MIIDFHTHIYPDKIAAKAVASISDFYKIPIVRNGTVDDLINAGKEGGIDRFVVFSAAAVPGQVQRINEYIASCCKDYPQFTGFGNYDKAHRVMLYSVISANEVTPLINAIKNVDPAAFVNVLKTEQVNGRFYQRPKD
jgi:hypothetical protein